jgi:tyrosyl-tRNA synthetase
MGKMLAKESVERRIASENGLVMSFQRFLSSAVDFNIVKIFQSFTEFSYQIFQAFDWLHLYREYDCSIQIGGTDQVSFEQMIIFFLI